MEDPWVEPDESMFTRSVSPEDAPDKPTYVEIEYEKGDPVAINGDSQSPASILASLNKVCLGTCQCLDSSPERPCAAFHFLSEETQRSQHL